MHQVTFTEKNGKAGSAMFTSLVLATMYAKTVKGGQVIPGGSDEGVTLITKCGTPEEENAKRESLNVERGAEAYMEAGTQTRLMGGSSSEALDNASFAESEVRATCFCGKHVSRGMTACYSCRRYR